MSHWKPSHLAIPLTTEPLEGRLEALNEFNISRKSTGGIDGANRVYSTEAEDPHSVAPFLRDAMQQDYRQRHLTERTYLVLQGGDTLYHTPQDVAQRQFLPLSEEFIPVIERQPDNRGQRVRHHLKASFPERASQLGHTLKGQGDTRGRGGWP